jgi:hypothetical protein
MRHKHLLALVISLVLSFLSSLEAKSWLSSDPDCPNLISFAAGDYNVFHTTCKYNQGMVQLEFKGPNFFSKKYFKVRSFAAGLVNLQGSLWIGGGVNFDIYFGNPFVVTLSIGPGYFYRGKGKDLGYPMEVRSSIELAYKFKSHARLGTQFYHLSNASFSPRNPGVECLLLFYAIPL